MASRLNLSNPLAYLVLLALSLLLRLPALDSDFVTTDEAIYLTNAQRIVAGFAQYEDTWDNKPPVIVWVYAAFVGVFGNWALMAIRLATAIYLFMAAVVFSQLLSNFRFVKDASLWPGALFILAFSTPWYTLELNAELLMVLPALLMLVWLAPHIEKQPSDILMFRLGLVCALLVGLKFQAFVFFLVYLLGYAFTGQARAEALASLTGGLLLGLLSLGLILYLNHTLPQFVDLALVYSLDYISLGANPGEWNTSSGFLEYFKHWGGPLVLGTMGFFGFRVRLYSTNTRQRRMETYMALWFWLGLATVFMGGNRFYLHYIHLALPAVLFYTVLLVEELGGAWRQLAWIAILAFPAFTTANFVVCRIEPLYAWFSPMAQPNGWLAYTHEQLNPRPEEQAARQALDQLCPHGSIWIASFKPELYVRWQRQCASRYTNFSIAYYKMDWLDHNLTRPALLSKPESLEAVYQSFARERPAAVYDPEGLFEEIQSKIPLLLQDYTKVPLQQGSLFVRQGACGKGSSGRNP